MPLTSNPTILAEVSKLPDWIIEAQKTAPATPIDKAPYGLKHRLSRTLATNHLFDAIVDPDQTSLVMIKNNELVLHPWLMEKKESIKPLVEYFLLLARTKETIGKAFCRPSEIDAILIPRTVLRLISSAATPHYKAINLYLGFDHLNKKGAYRIAEQAASRVILALTTHFNRQELRTKLYEPYFQALTRSILLPAEIQEMAKGAFTTAERALEVLMNPHLLEHNPVFTAYRTTDIEAPKSRLFNTATAKIAKKDERIIKARKIMEEAGLTTKEILPAPLPLPAPLTPPAPTEQPATPEKPEETEEATERAQSEATGKIDVFATTYFFGPEDVEKKLRNALNRTTRHLYLINKILTCLLNQQQEKKLEKLIETKNIDWIYDSTDRKEAPEIKDVLGSPTIVGTYAQRIPLFKSVDELRIKPFVHVDGCHKGYSSYLVIKSYKLAQKLAEKRIRELNHILEYLRQVELRSFLDIQCKAQRDAIARLFQTHGGHPVSKREIRMFANQTHQNPEDIEILAKTCPNLVKTIRSKSQIDKAICLVQMLDANDIIKTEVGILTAQINNFLVGYRAILGTTEEELSEIGSAAHGLAHLCQNLPPPIEKTQILAHYRSLPWQDRLNKLKSVEKAFERRKNLLLTDALQEILVEQQNDPWLDNAILKTIGYYTATWNGIATNWFLAIPQRAKLFDGIAAGLQHPTPKTNEIWSNLFTLAKNNPQPDHTAYKTIFKMATKTVLENTAMLLTTESNNLQEALELINTSGNDVERKQISQALTTTLQKTPKIANNNNRTLLDFVVKLTEDHLTPDNDLLLQFWDQESQDWNQKYRDLHETLKNTSPETTQILYKTLFPDSQAICDLLIDEQAPAEFCEQIVNLAGIETTREALELLPDRNPNNVKNNLRTGVFKAALETMARPDRAMISGRESYHRHLQEFKSYRSLAMKLDTSAKIENHYVSLGIPRQYTQSQLETSIRILRIILHPDQFQDEEEKAKTQKWLQTAENAFLVLDNPTEKAKYEKRLHQFGYKYNTHEFPSTVWFGRLIADGLFKQIKAEEHGKTPPEQTRKQLQIAN